MNSLCGFDQLSGSLSDCDSECTALHHCFAFQRGDGVCDSECNIAVCGFDFGDCLSCDSNCLLSQISNGMCEESCNTAKCGFDGEDCADCRNNCELGTAQRPTKRYITASKHGQNLGTWRDPFFLLSNAFGSLLSRNIEVSLLAGVHQLERMDIALEINMKIATLLCEHSVHAECASVPATILSMDFETRISTKGELTFENVIISGKTSLKSNCVSANCFYCPYIVLNEKGQYVTDQGEIVDQSTVVDEAVCKSNNVRNLLGVESNGMLTLVNVSISDIRYQPQSIIFAGIASVVMLTNVTFSNIIVAKDNGAVISYQNCFQPSCQGGLIEYRNGIVEYLSNGYEFTSNLQTGLFLKANNVGNVHFSNVTFQNNIVKRTQMEGLLAFQLVGKLLIEDCIFRHNIATRIISIFGQGTTLSPRLDTSGHNIDYAFEHVRFSNLTFDNNLCEMGLLSAGYSGNMQTISFLNCSFKENLSLKESLLSFKFDGELTSEIITGSDLFAARRLNLTLCSFARNFGSSVLSFVNVANVELRDCLLSLHESNLVASPIDAFFTALTSDPRVYLKIRPPLSLDKCQQISSFKKTSGAVIIGVTFQDNSCKSLHAEDLSRSFEISTSIFIRNRAQISVLSLTNITIPIVLSSTKFEQNQNSFAAFQGVIFIDSGLDVSFARCTFLRNQASFGGVIAASDPKRLSITDSYFTGNSAILSAGGAIAILLGVGDERNILYIKSSEFRENSCLSGLGGGVYISSSSYSRPFLITIDSVMFVGNSAIGGFSIFVDMLVTVATESRVSNSVFTRNVGDKGSLWVDFINGSMKVTGCQFIGNVAGVSSGIFQSNGVLNVTDSVFRDNTSKSIVTLPGTVITKTMNLTDCIFTNNTGVALFAQMSRLKIAGCQFQGNADSAINLLESTKAEIELTSFVENSAKADGGAAYASGRSEMKCEKCSFRNNSASKGGALFFEQSSKLNISESVFELNSAGDKGSAVFILSSLTPASTISGSVFRENHSNHSGTLSLLSAAASLTNVSFDRNTARHTSPGIILNLSVLNAKASKFSNQHGSLGSFLYSTTESISEFHDCNFNNGSALSGGMLNIATSSILLENCVIRNMSGTGFLVSTSSTIQISGVSMTSLTCPENCIAFITEGSLTLSQSDFKGFSKGGILGDKLISLNVTGSHFSNGLGGVLSCYRCQYVTISQSIFEDNSGTLGGAIALTTQSDTPIQSQYVVESTAFRRNSALRGGAAYSDNISINFTNCSFESNSVKNSTAKGATSDLWGHGGAVTTDCTGVSFCLIEFFYSTFFSNIAEVSGGAIAWRDVKPNITFCEFSSNTAEYGHNISSFPITIQMPSSRRALSSITLSDIASGQEVTQPLTVALFDHYRQIVNIDSESYAELQVVSKATFLTGVTKVKAEKGVFTFDNFKITAKPGTNADIDIFTSAVDTSKQAKSPPTDTFVPKVHITARMRECIQGETYVKDTCLVCESGKYSLELNSSTCIVCPLEAVCLGSFFIVPRPGYWRSSKDTDVFYPCMYAPACIGSGLTVGNLSYMGECAKGYSGNLCQACVTGYSRSGKDECQKCPDNSVNVVRLVFISIAAGSFAGLMVYTTLKSANRPKSVSSIYMKILMNYLQIVILTASFNLKWPSLVLNLFAIQETTGSVSEQAFSFDCYLQTDDKSCPVVYSKLMIMVVMPILIAVAAILVWVSILGYRQTFRFPKNELIATLTVLFFIIHPTLTKQFFSMFACMTIGNKQFLLQQLDNPCWNQQHTMFSCGCALPAVIVWVLGVPALCLLYLVREKRRLEQSYNKMRLGFVYNGYRAKAYYWEFIILYRKIAIIICSVFLSTVSVSIQALCVLLLLIASMYIQDINKPYTTPELNRMELKSLTCATVTIYCGLLFLTGDIGEVTRTILFVSILFVNAVFLWYWGRKMFGFYMVLLVSKIPCLRRKLGNINRVKDGLDDNIFVDPVEREAFPLRRWKQTRTTVKETNRLQTMIDLYIMKLDHDSAALHQKDSGFGSPMLPNSPLDITQVTEIEGEREG